MLEMLQAHREKLVIQRNALLAQKSIIEDNLREMDGALNSTDMLIKEATTKAEAVADKV